MSLILETKATKEEILELYLNDVYLGNRGSFALHGVAEASKIYFAKDVRNLTLSEAALIAGIIQSPFNHSPFNNPAKAKDRRDIVLRAMADAGYITARRRRARAAGTDRGGRARGRQRSALLHRLHRRCARPRLSPASAPSRARSTSTRRSTSTCSAMPRMPCAPASRTSTRSSARRKRGPKRVAQAALVAIDPRSGEILAFIGGRNYGPVAIQSRGGGAPADRLDLQAVRLSRGV